MSLRGWYGGGAGSWWPRAGALLVAILIATADGRGQAQPPPRPAPKPFSDEAVSRAIEKAAKYLVSKRQADGSWRDPGGGGLNIQGNDRQVGGTALFAYALLAKGVSAHEAGMSKTLQWLEKQRTNWTYAVSLRSQAWMEAALQDPTKYRPLVMKDAFTLIKAAGRGSKPVGSYGYRVDLRGPLNDHDPSNGQYGVLGVWAAHQLQGEVPKGYWSAVMKYWAGRQEADGGWKYGGGDKNSTGTMTTAGVATTFVCVDALLADQFVQCRRTNEVRMLRKGLEWFDRNFARTLRDDGLCHGGHGDRYYYLFGVERVGLASGRRYFGKTDWYKLGATWLINEQSPEGSWQGHFGRTVATAYAVLFLVRGQHALLADQFVQCRRTNEVHMLRKGLEWFDRNFARTLQDDGLCHGGHGDRYYYLFGVERVGLASGRRYFGKTDWYKLGATWLINQQSPEGWWQGHFGREVATAYAVLFLVRGQHALLFNRLEYDGDWNNRPRALANLCRWARRVFERDVYWQIVNMRVPVSEWHDAPLMLITGSEAPKFSDDQLAKLREYVWQGGTIISVTECNGGGFRNGMREVYRKLFPGREIETLPSDHPLYTVHARLPFSTGLCMISNGVRPFAVHTDTDVAMSWQLNRYLTQAGAFDAAANVAMYVTGKQLRNRGTIHWPPKPPRAKGPTVKLARLRYAGNFDPEPLAWERTSRRLAREAKVNLDVVGPIAPAELKASGAAVATLTGTGRLELPDADKNALKEFVHGGGLLLIDAAGGVTGGGAAFAESAEAIVRDLFGRRSLRTLATLSVLYQIKGHRIDRVKYPPKTRIRLGGREPRLKAVMVGDRIGVIFSPEDLTVGLTGCTPVGCDGYQGDSAYQIARNIVLYVAAGGKPETR